MIERKNNSCSLCGKPSGTWTKCVSCRAKIYMERSRKKREAMGHTQDKLDKWYKMIWEMSKGYCAESGRSLAFDKKFCCHILPKSKYPYFKHDLRNGILLDLNFHHILDQGSESQRKNLKVWEYISLQRQLLLSEVGMTYEEEHWLNSKF